MKELFKKKSGNKGFTLAELLVVIAILAILIAIAIPVFSGMVAEANLRVNQANIRTVRSAAVAHILSNLDQPDSTGQASRKLNIGLDASHCWVATPEVDNNGDIDDLNVFVQNITAGGVDQNWHNGISTQPLTTFRSLVTGGDDTDTFFVLSDDTTSKFATVKPKASDGDRNTYWVQVVITDLDPVVE